MAIRWSRKSIIISLSVALTIVVGVALTIGLLGSSGGATSAATAPAHSDHRKAGPQGGVDLQAQNDHDADPDAEAAQREDPNEDEEAREATVPNPNAATASCGVERWAVKTGTDADAGKINLNSTTSSSIAYLDSLSAPATLPSNNRVLPTEATVFQLNVTLVEYKLETDSDFHLVLSDGIGHTMIAEIPDPACVGTTSPLKSGVTKARGEFTAKYTPTGSFKTANVPATVTGVGFFDFLHGQTGVAPNGIELHSVLDIQFGTSPGGTVTVTNPGNQTSTVGTAVSLPIHATDSAGGTLTYTATGLPTGLSINATTGSITGTPTTTGTSSVTVTAKDSTGPSGSAQFSWTIAGSGSCTATQLLGNPGFETGTATPWAATSGIVADNASEPPHSGTWDAWLDGYGSTHTDTLAQTVTLPTGCASYTASFYLHIDTAEPTTTAYDKLQVQVLNSSGAVLKTLATFSNTNANTGYGSHSYSLAAYAGQTVTLRFTGAEDSIQQTSFVLDDTAITTS